MIVSQVPIAERYRLAGELGAGGMGRVWLAHDDVLDRDVAGASHRAGVLHRDVKPSNVLMADDGTVVLTDFGLATFEEGDNAASRPGLILGSPHYVAPERAQYGISTPKSDLWSLGATLYTAVEGRSPYARSTTLATLTALATQPPDPVCRAGALRPVLDGLLRKDPRTRMDVAEAERLLRRVAAGVGDDTSTVNLTAGLGTGPAPPRSGGPTLPVPTGPRLRAWRWVAASVAVGVAATVGGAVARSATDHANLDVITDSFHSPRPGRQLAF